MLAPSGLIDGTSKRDVSRRFLLIHFKPPPTHTHTHTPPPGAYLFQTPLGEGLIGKGGVFELLEGGGVLFYSAKMMVSLLFKEQEYKLEKLKFKKLEVYAADQKQI